jgi:type I restriction enzyme M protein
VSGVFALYEAVCHRIAERVTELADRYEQTLPMLESDVKNLEKKVESHLKKMGFEW